MKLNLNVERLVLAGGGNRCWWQAGALSYLMETGWQLPKSIVGTSAGAAIAVSCFAPEGPTEALQSCLNLYKNNKRIFSWCDSLSKGKLDFAHQRIYPEWLSTFCNNKTFFALKESNSELLIAVTRPSPYIGLWGSIFLGTLAYVLDKQIVHHIHPVLPKKLGLKQAFINANLCDSVSDLQKLLYACAAAPPIMPAIPIFDAYTFDGGYTDNAPIPLPSNINAPETLVMLTRHYKNKSILFQHQGRLYWQPSKPIPVSTWDCTHKATVKVAFDMGVRDAHLVLERLQRNW